MLETFTKRIDTRPRRGAIATLTAVALLPIILLCLLAVNVAYMQLVRTELRRSSDAAARAGARTLSLSQSSNQAIAKAKEVALLNAVAGTPLALDDGDIELGSVEHGQTGTRLRFTTGNPILNAVRVTGRRTADSAGGAVAVIAPGLFDTGTFQPVLSSTAMQYDRDIALVIDRSSSMAFAWDELGNNVGSRVPRDSPPGWEFESPWDYDCRWMDMVRAIDRFFVRLVDTHQAEKVAMASFDSGSRSRLDVSLTTDYGSISGRLDHYTQRDHYRTSTNIGSGMEFALEALADSSVRRPYAQPVMVILTDGVNKRGPSPQDLAYTAAGRNILIYTITFSDEADTGLMASVAATGSGKHFHAVTPSQLADAFEEVAETIPTILSD